MKYYKTEDLGLKRLTKACIENLNNHHPNDMLQPPQPQTSHHRHPIPTLFGRAMAIGFSFQIYKHQLSSAGWLLHIMLLLEKKRYLIMSPLFKDFRGLFL